MDISIADFLVHVDENLQAGRMGVLEDWVRADPCVISASMSRKDSHLMLVAYNPACTSRARIMERFAEQGLHAEAVGL
ncbi:MAG: hypothetical protein AB7U30_08195 [Sulfuricellaceae bacterium]|jgi:hypothetical protein